MQFIAPFIHAHAFGVESIEAHAAHAHAAEDVFHNHALSGDLKLHIAELNQQDTIEMPQEVGSIIKVANGVKRNADFDIVAIFLTSFLLLVFFALIRKYLTPPFSLSLYPQRFYSSHAPRAPPY